MGGAFEVPSGGDGGQEQLVRALGAILAVTGLIGCGFGALEMWPVQTERCYECEMYTGF